MISLARLFAAPASLVYETPTFALTVGFVAVSKVRYMPLAPVVGGWAALAVADDVPFAPVA